MFSSVTSANGPVFASSYSMLKKMFVLILLVTLAGCFFEDEDHDFGGWHGHHWHGDHHGHEHHWDHDRD